MAHMVRQAMLSSRNHYNRPLRFESLEDRRMLSVDLVTKATFSSSTVGGSQLKAGAFSANNRYVVFASSSTNLVSGLNLLPTQNIYRYDRTTGQVVLVSVNSAGTGGGNGYSDEAVISADGNIVAFMSAASNLSPLDTNGTFDIYARNLTTGVTTLVSVNSAGNAGGNGDSVSAGISGDGNLVTFASAASNLSLVGYEYELRYLREESDDRHNVIGECEHGQQRRRKWRLIDAGN